MEHEGRLVGRRRALEEPTQYRNDNVAAVERGQCAGQAGGAGGFTVSDDEFIAGTPSQIAEMIIEQCRTTGAEHFLAVLHWGAVLAEVRAAHELFGQKVIPVLKTFGTKTA